MAIDEERGLTDAYRAVVNVPKPQGQGLNDLYVRFFRMAERRIAEKTGHGVVCFISNYSWLDGLSFTGMRERFMSAFDHIWVDNLNGDKYKTGKLTPTGDSDPSIFSTEQNREGIQVGTAVTLLVRREDHEPAKEVAFRNLWGISKRAQLLNVPASTVAVYQSLSPSLKLGLPFIPTDVASGYLSWPSLTELIPKSFPGIKTSRDQFLVDIDHDRLSLRVGHYFSRATSDQQMAKISPVAMADAARFDASATRATLLQRGMLLPNVVEFQYRPFDRRWLYWEPVGKLLDEKREEMWPHREVGRLWLAAAQKWRRGVDSPALVHGLGSLHLIERGANLFPMMLRDGKGLLPNASEEALAYLATLPSPPSALFHHVAAVLASRAFVAENESGLGMGWPRLPLPDTANRLENSGHLGTRLEELQNVGVVVPGVTAGAVRNELRTIGGLVAGGTPDYKVRARWGIRGQSGVAMPGRGTFNRRDYTGEERAAIESGAAALALTKQQMFDCLGDRTYDIYANGSTYWKNIPEKVWLYTMGGYQVLKKWLSYREEALLGRALKPEEAGYFRDVARRIAAILLMGPELDANYIACRDNAIPWPPS
jgi:hypothetical protein